MLKHSIFAIAFVISVTTLMGCSEEDNRLVEQPDMEMMKAKQQELAQFQEKMAEHSKLPGQR